MILLHYPTKTRLKIWATTEILNPKDHPELAVKLTDEAYGAKVERLVVFKIEAYDWNCPQHITPKFTIEEFKQLGNQHPEIMEEICPGKTINHNEKNSN